MSTNIKKAYVELYEILEANKNKKVSTILPQLVELMTAKQSQKNFITDEDGNVTHIYCYYHKQWEDISVAEYGAKKSSATGLNSMCKEGVSSWTKQQRQLKAINDEAMDLVVKGELQPGDIVEWKTTREQELRVIVPREDGHIADI